MSFTISRYDRPEVEVRLAKLNDRIRRAGIDFTAEATYNETTDKKGRALYDVEFNFDDIRLPGGWDFVATIEHGDGLNIVHSYDGAPDTPVQYRTDAPTCDHCGHDRDRKNTIVVRNEDGEFQRVGTTCARTYLGIAADKLVPIMGLVASLDDEDEFMSGYSRTHVPTVETVLRYAAMVCRYEGFKPASFGEDSTKVQVSKWINPSQKDIEENEVWWAKAAKTLRPTDVDDAMTWLDTRDASSDYIHNLNAAVAMGYVTPRNMGLVVSLMGVYLREQEQIEQEKAEKKAPSEWIGNVKDRIDFIDGEIIYARLGPGFGPYDPETIYAMIRFGDDVVEIKTNVGTAVGAMIEDAAYDPEATDRKTDPVSFKATVKEHRTDKKGRKITKVTRGAVIK